MKTTDFGRRQCFISHCSEDREVMGALHRLMSACFDTDSLEFFNTSEEEHSTYAGQGLSQALRSALTESEIMIAVITDSYLRSPICIAELSAFWYMDKPVIPLVYSSQGAGFLEELMGQNVIYIDLVGTLSADQAQRRAKKMIRTLSNAGFPPRDEETAMGAFESFFLTIDQANSSRPFIGSGDAYRRINRYCDEFGISLFQNTSLSSAEMSAKLEKAETIYILSTTGNSLISSLSSEFLPAALSRGQNVIVLVPNRYSSYVLDVAEIESPDNAEAHKLRFAREFDGVMYNLKDSLARAKKINPASTGEVYVGCTHTALRQTITLAVTGEEIWGWLSLTMPPKRTVDGTPSLEFSGKIGSLSIANLAYEHLLSIRNMAERRNHFVCLSQHPDFQAFFLENDAAEDYWRNLYDQAKLNTASADGEAELIEVAAQHPLRANGAPGAEFKKRLDLAAELYRRLKDESEDEDKEVRIYVPGSVHVYKGKADPCSLSDSGVKYLLGKGIPEEDLIGEDANRKYKGDLGVYNTADECFVASRLFLDGDYGRLHCVCSPNQLYRKKLFYIAFGVIPYYHTVSVDKPAHDDVYELFHSIPAVLYEDHTWQGADSVFGNRTRQERDPRYALNTDK
ncbi:MAG: TIR domain-containing protein [Oscillospiraceae bacterium]|nr:TIR domain-containing protein [Oscillospiraceae bacterium]